jgi:hypothetical protein
MRLVFTWVDHLRTLTQANMTAFAAAVVAQFQETIGQINSWAAVDHNGDGTHRVIHLAPQGTQPQAAAEALVFYYDGADLKVVFPNGTTGTVTIT